jgi:hypothetical protein
MKKEFEGIHLIVQRNAKMHSKHEVFYCYKVFQTCNIEREFFFFFKKKKQKETARLSCSLSLLYMASSMKKQTPHLIFIQYESENERG